MLAAILCLALCIGAYAEEGDDGQQESKDRWTLVPFPVLAYSSDTGFLGGFVFNALYNPDVTDPLRKTGSLGLIGFYTQKSQWLVSSGVEWYFSEDRYKIDTSVGFFRYPSFFYGIGPDTDLDDAEAYTPLGVDLTGAFRFRLARNLYLGPRLLFQAQEIAEREEDGRLAGGNIAGSNGVILFGWGPHISCDRRDSSTYPTSGFLANVEAEFFRGEWGSSEDFTRLFLDYRHYLSLYGEHVLAAQVFTAITLGTVPFQALPDLGSNDLMRGYKDSRFRDRTFVAAQLEYRFPLFWRFGGVLFGGIGQVGPSIGELALDDLKYAGGLGFRFAVTEDPKVNLRLDLALSPEGFEFYITALEAF
jgi:outer membrane protein assembly factor BamA